MVRRRSVLGGVAGLMAAGNARADEADRNWMVVRLGGQRFRLPRALDDGASDQPDPSGSKREEILLRADLPDVTAHVMKEELRGESPFLGAMVEILASSLAASPAEQASITPGVETDYMRRSLGVFFNPSHPDEPTLTTVPTDDLSFPAPKGSGMRFVTAPDPFFTGLYSKIFYCGERTAPTDIIATGGGEASQVFLYATARFKLTYGEHLVGTWSQIKSSVVALFDRSKV